MKPKRLAYALLGFAAAGLGIWVVVTQHVSWWQLAVFAIAPDVTLLFGFHRGLQRGQLDPRVVPFYNAVHRFWAPAVLVVIALVLHADAWVAAGLAWSAHIAFDRSLGFGLRTGLPPREVLRILPPLHKESPEGGWGLGMGLLGMVSRRSVESLHPAGFAADLPTGWGGEVSRTGGTVASGPGPTR